MHHWDEYGLKKDVAEVEGVPEAVERAQREMVEFVEGWMEEWREENGGRDGASVGDL